MTEQNVAKLIFAYFFEDLDDFFGLSGLGHRGDVEDDPLGHGVGGGDDAEVEDGEYLSLGGGGRQLYKARHWCGHWTAGLSRYISGRASNKHSQKDHNQDDPNKGLLLVESTSTSVHLA